MVERASEVESRRFYVYVCGILKLTDTLEVVWDTHCLYRREKRQSHVTDEVPRASLNDY